MFVSPTVLSVGYFQFRVSKVKTGQCAKHKMKIVGTAGEQTQRDQTSDPLPTEHSQLDLSATGFVNVKSSQPDEDLA